MEQSGEIAEYVCTSHISVAHFDAVGDYFFGNICWAGSGLVKVGDFMDSEKGFIYLIDLG